MAIEARGPTRRRRPLLLMLILTIIAGAVTFGFRWIARVNITKLTDQQIQSTLEPDLKWIAPPLHARRVEPGLIESLGNEKTVVRIIQRLDDSKLDPRRDLALIRSTWPVTSRAAAIVQGRVLGGDTQNFNYFTSLPSISRVARLYGVQIDAEIAAGDRSNTMDIAEKALTFARFLRRSPVGTEVDCYSRATMVEDIYKQIEKLASSALLAPDDLGILLRGIDPAPTSDTQLANAIRGDFEYRIIPQLMELASGVGIDNLFAPFTPAGLTASDMEAGNLDLPVTLEAAAEFQRVTIANCGKAWNLRDRSVTRSQLQLVGQLPPPPTTSAEGWLKDSLARLRFKAAMHSLPNSIGILAILHLQQGNPQSLLGSCYHRTQIEGHRLTLMIAIYRRTHGGRLPESLRDVHPPKGQGEPVDFYSGAIFRYSKSRRAFWSVGENGVDDGGKDVPPRSLSPDIVWKL